MFTNVVIDGSGPYLDRFFTYRVPSPLQAEIRPGQYLKVPWGKKQRGAVVHSLSAELPADLEPSAVKDVLGIVEVRPLIGPLQWSLGAWLREFYYSTWPEALRCLAPGPVLQALRKGTKSRTKLVHDSLAEVPSRPQLTTEQETVWNVLRQHLDQGESFLLHGVTGSGKTELYLRASEEVLRQGKTVLVLVPEVSLTPQAQTRYRERFGAAVSILHSGLTSAQRREQWWRIRDGDAQVVVGTRSAIFAPLEACGLVVIDEEHDGSYKQGSDLRYHARQVAAWLSRQTSCSVILGSATPSLESYTLAVNGRYRLLKLSQRVSGRPLPGIKLMKGEGVPHQVLRALAERKERGEQAVILLNRRGFSPYLQCGDCSWVPECRSCSISLTYHQSNRTLRCHYCGYTCKAPSGCQECGSNRLEFPGRGTERVEAELKVRLPELRVARLDRDTVGGKSSVFETTFRAFEKGEFDCLLGTQMVAKGLDFPAVTLVVVLGADMGLHLPDFRAAERSFSLLTQVAGRAGRGDSPGEVLLVCRQPEHEIFTDLIAYDWTGFMTKEQQARKLFGYPPFARLLRLLLSDEKEERLEKFALSLEDSLTDLAAEFGVDVLGPAPCPIEKIQGRFRWQILLRASRLQDLKRLVRKFRSTLEPGKTRLILDPDPLELM